MRQDVRIRSCQMVQETTANLWHDPNRHTWRWKEFWKHGKERGEGREKRGGRRKEGEEGERRGRREREAKGRRETERGKREKEERERERETGEGDVRQRVGRQEKRHPLSTLHPHIP